jgi:D-arabinose 1-dehydrogenase-like Zn-dependent alcohol dehydrogenase
MTCGVTAMVIVGTAGAVRLDASEVGCGGIGLLAVQAAIAMSSATAIAIVIAKMAIDAAPCGEFQ